ncbi:MAG: metallophosphoesterase [bacterium]
MNGKQLFDAWQASGLSQRALADKLNLNFNSMHGKIHRYQTEDIVKTGEDVKMKDDINQREYTSKGTRIKTLEQLIEACEIDLSKWAIVRHIINKWEVGAKVTEKDLEWNNGIIDGYVRSEGHLVVEPLYQVKVWLEAREPEAIHPVISPVEIKASGLKPVKPKDRDAGTALILADPHFGFSRNLKTGQLEPFHDRAALAIAIQLVEYVNPDIILILGDLLDLAEWSDKFIRSPDMYNTTQPAIVEASWWLAQIRKAAPKATVHLLEGNHEERITRAISKQLPYAYGLTTSNGMPVLSVPNLIGTDALSIKYVPDYPNGEVWVNYQFRAIHGDRVRAKSGATATAILEDAQASTVFGHIHRIELATKTVFDSNGAKSISAFSPGCLCRIDGTVPSIKGKMNWQQGIGVVNFDETFVVPIPVPIEQGQAMYEGQTFKGQDYLKALKSDTGWDF